MSDCGIHLLGIDVRDMSEGTPTTAVCPAGGRGGESSAIRPPSYRMQWFPHHGPVSAIYLHQVVAGPPATFIPTAVQEWAAHVQPASSVRLSCRPSGDYSLLDMSAVNVMFSRYDRNNDYPSNWSKSSIDHPWILSRMLVIIGDITRRTRGQCFL